MSEVFRSVPHVKVCRDQGMLAVYPGLEKFACLEVTDPESGTFYVMDMDVEDAREIRDWLTAALPSDGGGEHG